MATLAAHKIATQTRSALRRGSAGQARRGHTDVGAAALFSTTFRQVGIATGIAALESIFTSEGRAHVSSGLHAAHLRGAHAIATAISSGQTHQAIAHVPPQARGIVGELARASFVAGLNEILLVAAVLVRGRDRGAPVDSLERLRRGDRGTA